jgi:Collagen triple helix repeat (20 copies)
VFNFGDRPTNKSGRDWTWLRNVFDQSGSSVLCNGTETAITLLVLVSLFNHLAFDPSSASDSQIQSGMTHALRHITTAMAFVAIAGITSTPALAEGKRPTIAAAAVSTDQSTLYVVGTNFNRSSIAVNLHGITLGGVQVDASGKRLSAVMPVLPPGTYRLVIMNGRGGNQDSWDALDVTLGTHGPVGPQGPEGARGPVGPQGPIGETGPQGVKGDKGDKGDRGDVGPQGQTGPVGPVGAVGPMGPTGPTGAMGLTGAQGLTGPQGPQGPQGAPGAMGPQGFPGSQGVQGPQGPAGPAPFFIAGWVQATSPTQTVPPLVIRAGAGFTVARRGTSAGSYRITVPARPTGAFLITTITFVGPSGAVARISGYSVETATGNHLIDIDVTNMGTGAVDRDFMFTLVERS